jgi:hypothetical protein
MSSNGNGFLGNPLARVHRSCRIEQRPDNLGEDLDQNGDDGGQRVIPKRVHPCLDPQNLEI